jgi:hypothetical protein
MRFRHFSCMQLTFSSRMPTITEERGNFEHTRHPARSVREPQTQSADSVLCALACIGEACRRFPVCRKHFHPHRERTRRADLAQAAGFSRPGRDHEKREDRGRSLLHGCRRPSRGERSARGGCGIRAAKLKILAGLVSPGGLDSAQSGSKRFCEQSGRPRTHQAHHTQEVGARTIYGYAESPE